MITHAKTAKPVAIPPTMPAAPKAPQASALPRSVRKSLLNAGYEVRECWRVLEKAELNVVGEVLRGQGDFIEFEHYPSDDVRDQDTHSQYYYHAHDDQRAENGHFHTFIRTGELEPAPTCATPRPGSEPWPQGTAALAHLTGISMDDWGYPLGLFATNRWVTGETWYTAKTLLPLLPRFEIDHAFPSWPTNRWITAMVHLYQAHISALLMHRDAVIAAWQHAHPDQDVLEDRTLGVTGYLPISVNDWIEELERAL